MQPMNRRKAKDAKRIVFEPRVPEQKASEQSEPEAPCTGATASPEPRTDKEVPLRGTFAPVPFATERTFDLHNDGIIMCLPPTLTSATLVVFSDGTLALRRDGILYACDSSFLGDAITVEITDKIKKTGDVSFVLTGYETQIDC